MVRRIIFTCIKIHVSDKDVMNRAPTAANGHSTHSRHAAFPPFYSMHRPLEIPIMTSATCTNKKGTQLKLRPHTVF